jgi:serine/threonine protein kinase
VRNNASSLYYPICIGEALAEIYQIEHKVAHGGYSTVWLAYDMQHRKNVTLKVMKSGDVSNNEVKMLQHILSTVKDTSNLLAHLDSFSLQRPRLPASSSSVPSTRTQSWLQNRRPSNHGAQITRFYCKAVAVGARQLARCWTCS